jgi:antitoxin (DNA-binding transcriptional repressor) of toxin-antitoxin stability system
MTLSGHNESMKKAKVSELKARLSSYLADVRKGDILVVYDRATPIAQIVPMDKEAGNPKIFEAIEPLGELEEIRPVRLRKKIDIVEILSEARGRQ